MNKFILLILIQSIIFFAHAQNATIKGRVYDDKNEGLFSANIVVDASKGWATQSDFDGNYSLSVPAGKYYVLVSYIGKKDIIKEVTLVAGETITLDFLMPISDIELNIVTITGGKYEKQFGEEVISMEVLPSSIIQNSVSQSGEALNKVPGYTQLGESPSIRGGGGWSSTASSRTLFLVDDVPQNSPENGGIFMETLPLENLKQVEVLKGVSSALYGSSALNGVINFRTSWPTDTVPYRRITTGIGMYQKFTSNLMKSKNEKENRMEDPMWWWDDYNHLPVFMNTTYEHRQRFKNLDFVLGAHYRHDQSFRKDNETDRFRINGKIRHIFKKVEGLSIGTAWNYVYEDGGQFFFQSGSDELSLIPSDPADLLNSDVRTDYVYKRISVSPFLNYFDKKDNKHSLKTRYYNNQSTNFGLESILTNHIYGEYTFSKDFKSLGVTLTSGASGSFTKTSGNTFADGKHTATNASLFTQAEKRFFGKLTISGGIRVEYNQVDDIKPMNKLQFLSLFKKDGYIKSAYKPLVRFGANYEVIKGTFLRASFGQGFRVPTINEYFIETKRGISVIPNPDLIPEAGWNTEIGIKQGVKVGNWQGYFDVAGFYNAYIDLIDFEFGNTLAVQAQNLDDAYIAGFEFSALGQGELFTYPFQFLVGYSFINPILKDPSEQRKLLYPDTYQYLNYRSKHNFKMDIESTIKKITMGISGIYVSNMINIPATRGVNGITEFREANDKGYFTLDVRLKYNFTKKTNLAFIAKNVFNAQYMQRPGILEAPRNYTIQFSHEF